jgi:hypothetical protein
MARPSGLGIDVLARGSPSISPMEPVLRVPFDYMRTPVAAAADAPARKDAEYQFSDNAELRAQQMIAVLQQMQQQAVLQQEMKKLQDAGIPPLPQQAQVQLPSHVKSAVELFGWNAFQEEVNKHAQAVGMKLSSEDLTWHWDKVPGDVQLRWAEHWVASKAGSASQVTHSALRCVREPHSSHCRPLCCHLHCRPRWR